MKVKPENVGDLKIHEGPYGVPEPFMAGLAAAKPKLGASHPLEISERNVSF